MEFLQDLFAFIGRVLISGTFLWLVYEKITHWDQSIEYMKSHGVPNVNLILPVEVGIKIIGSILIFLGWYAHVGALLLLIVSIASLLKMHHWWKMSAPEAEVEKFFFFKDAAVIGGLFMILAFGSGRFGL